MSIGKFNGIYTLTCDICGEDALESFFDFYDAVRYKKRNRWKSIKHKTATEDIWQDVCPECQEEQNE